MIKNATKKKLLAELEKNGNVTISCLKSGVNRSTLYRWKQQSDEFKESAELAERIGRENNCDIAEQSLLLKVKEKDLGAIKYLLSHNSPKYKGKETSNVVIVHKKELTQTNPANDLYVPDEVQDMTDEEKVKWLNELVADLNMNMTSEKQKIDDE